MGSFSPIWIDKDEALKELRAKRDIPRTWNDVKTNGIVCTTLLHMVYKDQSHVELPCCHVENPFVLCLTLIKAWLEGGALSQGMAWIGCNHSLAQALFDICAILACSTFLTSSFRT